MPLITSTTQLNKWKFGKGPWSDKRGGGNSNQPYIDRDIPGVQYNNPNQTFESVAEGDLPVRSGPDFLLRNGFLAPADAARDVSRLSQMFFDLKSPNGLLFIAKENVLSRTSVKTPASYGIGYAGSTDYYFEDSINGLEVTGGGNINQGIYTPLSTLGQALGGFAGLHLNQLGLDPTDPMSGVVQGSLGGLFNVSLGLNTYEAATKKFNETSDGNRLVIFNNRANEVGNKKDQNLYSYSGGPGSILGIGKTNIKFADQRTGAANPQSLSNTGSFYEGGAKFRSYGKSIPGLSKFKIGRESEGAAFQYLFYNAGVSEESLFNTANTPSIKIGYNGPTQNFLTSVNSIVNSEGFTSWESNPSVLYKNNSVTFDQSQLIDKLNVVEGDSAGLYPTDFRKELYNVNGDNLEETKKSSVISLSPDYRAKNKDVRVFMGQPGKQGGQLRGDSQANGLSKNVWNYGIKATDLTALDKITAMPMYERAGPDTGQAINDLVKFRIAAINNDKTDGSAVYMHFRAFLDSFSDSYTATWNPVNYVGRGDTFYNYGGFGRTISLSFTAAAQSKAELIPMYKKLNYLASTLAPDYNEAGFMRGNMVRLTVGGYLYEQPGFITSLTYDVPQESSWEIAINEEGGYDRSVKELPHMIKVSGFQFTPIHNFLAQKPNDANKPTSRFISLSSGAGNSNYSDKYDEYRAEGDGGGDITTTT